MDVKQSPKSAIVFSSILRAISPITTPVRMRSPWLCKETCTRRIFHPLFISRCKS